MEATCPILGNMFAKNILCGFKLTKERVECHKLVKASFVLWPLWQRTSRRVKGPVPCIQPGEVEEKFRFAFRVGDGFQSKVWANLCQHGDDQRFGTQGGHVRSMRKATQPHEAQVPREKLPESLTDATDQPRVTSGRECNVPVSHVEEGQTTRAGERYRGDADFVLKTQNNAGLNGCKVSLLGGTHHLLS